MFKRQAGFTLIELIMVIVILGVLAAVALPRFASLQGDARFAKAQGLLGSARAASALVHAVFLARGVSPVDLEGTSITIVAQYPNAAGIAPAANITAAADGVTIATVGTTTTITMNGGQAGCNFTYAQATAGPPLVAPVFTLNATLANCT